MVYLQAPKLLSHSTFSHQRSRRPFNRDQQYGYHSMADLDWGWKRKRSDPAAVDKRHIGSVGSRPEAVIMNQLMRKFRNRSGGNL